MAKSGGSRAPRSPRGGRPAPRRAAPTGRQRSRDTAQRQAPAPPAPQDPRTFRLGAIPGATPGKWISLWAERMPEVPLELVPVSVSDQHAAVTGATVDAALVRLPLDDDHLSVIPLYTEVPVVVVAEDSHLTAVDELELADLAGEVILVPRDDVLGTVVPGAVPSSFDRPATTEDAIAMVAAGVGAVIVPLSLARLHARRDVTHRPLRDGPPSTVALAWPRDADTDDVQTFIGIVRGRTANSSR